MMADDVGKATGGQLRGPHRDRYRPLGHIFIDQLYRLLPRQALWDTLSRSAVIFPPGHFSAAP